MQRFARGHIKNKKNSIGSPKEIGYDIPKPVLSGRIPQLNHHILSIDDLLSAVVVDPGCGDSLILKDILMDSQDDGSFSHRHIADDTGFELMLLILHFG